MGRLKEGKTYRGEGWHLHAGQSHEAFLYRELHIRRGCSVTGAINRAVTTKV